MVISLGPDIGGYLLKNADDGEIGDLSGKPIDPEIVLVFQPEDGGKDAFVHISAVERAGLTDLAEGQKVEFESQPGRDGKSSAENLRLVE